MKDLSKEFDNIPQEFDAEAIWQGIEKPARPFIYQPYVWTSVFIGIALVMFTIGLSMWSEDGNVDDRVDADEYLVPNETISAELSVQAVTDSGLKSTTGVNSITQEKTPMRSMDADGHATSEKVTFKTVSTNYQAASHLEERERSTDKVTLAVPKAISLIDLSRTSIGQFESLPALTTVLTGVQPGLPPVPETSTSPRISVAQKKARHSIALRLGAGSHWSSFTSKDDESADWRNSLERRQLDYSIGIGYAYQFDRGFSVSLSANYNLFKDRITTSHVSDSSGQEVLVDYKIYNHYHVFTGSVLFGKRFEQKNFFWDVNAGLGFRLFQVTDVDYFIAEGILADDVETERDYQSTGGLFFTANAAVGKYLSASTFFRVGCRMNSSMRLTSPEAQTEHRILPVSGFVEIGTRF